MLKCRIEHYSSISVDVRRGYTSILWSGEDRPRSYVRCGQWTHLHPGQRGCTSILCQERTANALDPSQERIEPERAGLDPMSDEDSDE